MPDTKNINREKKERIYVAVQNYNILYTLETEDLETLVADKLLRIIK